MDIQTLISDAQSGKHGPVHVLVGTETFLVERAVSLLRHACIDTATAAFNAEVLSGQSAKVEAIMTAARTLPMMARLRFVLVRDAEQLDAAGLDKLAGYVANPSPSTCLVVTASKLDGRSRVARVCREHGAWVDVEAPKGPALRSFVAREASGRGHAMCAEAVEALVDAVGDDLSATDDALERLSLFVGSGVAIGVDAVEACVTRSRVESIWALVDAVAGRDARGALRALGSLLDAREPPLKILAMVARQIRLVAKMRSALATGLRGPEAARTAGAPPFKARELADAARRFSLAELGRAFAVLSDADARLKGSKCAPERVIEETVLALCASPSATARQTGS